MTDDVGDALRRAAGAAEPLDLHAVHDRARQIRERRRRVSVGGAGAAALAIAVVISLLVGGPARDSRPDQLAGPSAAPATSDPSVGPSASTAPSAPVPSDGSSSSPAARDSMQLHVYFPESPGDCQTVRAVERSVPVTTGVLRAAMLILFTGPTPAESADGVGSLVGERPELLQDVRVQDGTAYVDLASGILDVNNLSTSCYTTAFLASVDSTATQFPSVERVCLTVDEDQDVLYDLLAIESPCSARPVGTVPSARRSR